MLRLISFIESWIGLIYLWLCSFWLKYFVSCNYPPHIRLGPVFLFIIAELDSFVSSILKFYESDDLFALYLTLFNYFQVNNTLDRLFTIFLFQIFVYLIGIYALLVAFTFWFLTFYLLFPSIWSIEIFFHSQPLYFYKFKIRNFKTLSKLSFFLVSVIHRYLKIFKPY